MPEQLIFNKQYNIGHICTKLQCELGKGDKVAIRWISASHERREFTFLEMDLLTSRFANVLKELDFSPGDIFFTFLPKMPEQFVAFLGALKYRAIAGTLFANFGEDALLDRLGDARAKGLITKKSFLKKIIKIRDLLPALRWILIVDSDEDIGPDILSFSKLMNSVSTEFITKQTGLDTPSVLHYTSGSTGKPKGVLHRHNSILHQHKTSVEILGLTSEDIHWCTADQGWVTGTSYGIIGPWSLGVTQVHYGGGYDADAWFELIEKEGVTVWYTAPTALRMLLREDGKVFEKYDLSKLRHISSVGEPLNPEVIHWARRTLGKDIYDTWWQTETGGIMIANREGVEVRPGSMGTPVHGIEPGILADDGSPLPLGAQGNLCIKVGWPSMFVTYLNKEEAYRSRFRDGWYYTGDTAYRDADGYYWFMGRSDDVINTAGHLISPFEIESALLDIEEVAESGVIGAPDELLFEKVVAYVVLHDRYKYSPELELKIRLYITNKVSSIATPQEIFFVKAVPKNKSGKIMRRVLKARYMGNDAGDISTLEE